MAELGFAVGLLAPCDPWPVMACWGFGIGSGFPVGWCAAGGGREGFGFYFWGVFF